MVSLLGWYLIFANVTFVLYGWAACSLVRDGQLKPTAAAVSALACGIFWPWSLANTLTALFGLRD